jgi:hypothetical protein
VHARGRRGAVEYEGCNREWERACKGLKEVGGGLVKGQRGAAACERVQGGEGLKRAWGMEGGRCKGCGEWRAEGLRGTEGHEVPRRVGRWHGQRA